MKDINIIQIGTDGKITFGIGSPATQIAGIGKLVQEVSKVILQTPGSDITKPNDGGGSQKIVGTNTPEKDSEFKADMSVVVSNTRDTIIRNQSGRSIPEDEMLAELNMIDATYDILTGTGNVTVLVTNVSGQLSTVTI